MDRRFKLLIVLVGLLFAAIHVRNLQQERRARGVTRISTESQLRRSTHDIFQRDGSLDHVLTLNFAIDLRERTTIDLAREIQITGGPVAFDVLERAVPLEVHVEKDQTSISFPPPPPALGAALQVSIAFSTPMAKPTYGWSYRAVALPWATTLVGPSVTSYVQAHVNGATSAPGWRCTEDEGGRICTMEARRRRSLAIPIERVDDNVGKLLFGLVAAVVISTLMYAIYRRWSAHAEQMGMPDDAPTMEEFVAELRRGPRQRTSIDEIDPLEAVALLARGITAVLGLLAAVFLVSQFEGGFFPIPGPYALTLVFAAAGLTLITAVGFATPRPWLAIAMIDVLLVVALLPWARFFLPGLVPLFAAVAMQLTAKQQQR